MTSWLTAERQDVADILTAAGFAAIAHVPARVNAPTVMVVPGSPYVEAGSTVASKLLRLDVWIVAGSGENEALTNALDEQIMRAVGALEAEDITVETVAQPIQWAPASGGQYLVSIISASYEAIPHPVSKGDE